MSGTTIVYYTDHSLSEPLFSFCREHLEQTAGDRPIVSVSHEPIDLGKNIAIGKQKRSWLLEKGTDIFPSNYLFLGFRG